MPTRRRAFWLAATAATVRGLAPLALRPSAVAGSARRPVSFSTARRRTRLYAAAPEEPTTKTRLAAAPVGDDGGLGLSGSAQGLRDGEVSGAAAGEGESSEASLMVSAETAAELKAARRERAEERLAVSARLNAIAYLNGGVLLFVGLGVLYELFHVDVEAIVALYTYALPVDDEAAFRLATSVDLLARLPMDQIHAYEALVPTNPVFYKACTSGVAYTLGDLVSQIYQGRTLRDVDLARSARSGAAGFVGHGPLCHYWMTWMEAHLDCGGAWYGTGVKVLADQTVWSLYLNAMYSGLIGIFALRDPREVWADVKKTSWPALRSSWRFWPFVHTISFSHAVPLDLKLLWVDAMEIVWVTILSKVANDDKDARVEDADGDDAGSVVKIVEAFGTDPSLEVELTREFEQDAALNADLAREGSFSGALAFELSRDVLAASWPLLVMWPVIYATFQLETAFLA